MNRFVSLRSRRLQAGLLVAVMAILTGALSIVGQPVVNPAATKIEQPQKASAPCEPAESLMCREERGEIPPEPEIQGIKLDFGALSGPSVVETFGWLTLAALVLAALVAALTPWTIRQTVPVAVGIAVVLVVIQHWWIFLIVVGLLVVALAVTAIRNLFAGGIRGVRGAGNIVPQGLSLLVIWEIIQTLWTNGTIGAVFGNRAGNQNQPPAQPPAQNP